MGMFSSPNPEKIARKMAAKEEKRLADAEERSFRRKSFEATEGKGIMERAQISLGDDLQEFDEDIRQTDSLFETGLVI